MAIWRAMDPRTKFEIIEHASESYVAVASRLQGGGIGTRMLRFCEDHARSIGASELSAHARETAVRFYVQNGFATEGEYFEEAGIPHVVVRKRL